MRRVGQARRRDTAETGIRKALEAAGATVIPISGKGAPDLFVCYQGQMWGVEVKSTKAAKLTPAQTASGAGTLWPVVRSVDEALAVIGVRGVAEV